MPLGIRTYRRIAIHLFLTAYLLFCREYYSLKPETSVLQQLHRISRHSVGYGLGCQIKYFRHMSLNHGFYGRVHRRHGLSDSSWCLDIQMFFLLNSPVHIQSHLLLALPVLKWELHVRDGLISHELMLLHQINPFAKLRHH